MLKLPLRSGIFAYGSNIGGLDDPLDLLDIDDPLPADPLAEPVDPFLFLELLDIFDFVDYLMTSALSSYCSN